jgi:hypothetical protein
MQYLKFLNEGYSLNVNFNVVSFNKHKYFRSSFKQDIKNFFQNFIRQKIGIIITYYKNDLKKSRARLRHNSIFRTFLMIMLCTWSTFLE